MQFERPLWRSTVCNKDRKCRFYKPKLWCPCYSGLSWEQGESQDGPLKWMKLSRGYGPERRKGLRQRDKVRTEKEPLPCAERESSG